MRQRSYFHPSRQKPPVEPRPQDFQLGSSQDPATLHPDPTDSNHKPQDYRDITNPNSNSLSPTLPYAHTCVCAHTHRYTHPPCYDLKITLSQNIRAAWKMRTMTVSDVHKQLDFCFSPVIGEFWLLHLTRLALKKKNDKEHVPHLSSSVSVVNQTASRSPFSASRLKPFYFKFGTFSLLPLHLIFLLLL